MHVAKFSISTSEQRKLIKPVNATSVWHLSNYNHNDTSRFIRNLLKASKTDEIMETYWISTPKSAGIEKEHTPIQIHKPKRLRDLEKLEEINPRVNANSRTQILSDFDSTDSSI